MDQLRKLLGRLQGVPPTDQRMGTLVDEYLRFMELVRAAPPQSLSPSAAIDDVWHCHVICTRPYAAFCERHFSAFVHYESMLKLGGSSGYQACLEAYRRRYATAPLPLCWPESPEVDNGTIAFAAAAGLPAATAASSAHSASDGGGEAETAAAVVAAGTCTLENAHAPSAPSAATASNGASSIGDDGGTRAGDTKPEGQHNRSLPVYCRQLHTGGLLPPIAYRCIGAADEIATWQDEVLASCREA
eukprot:TRINITY_DN4396_c0_g5_i1.p1 TRINITY_DN4396_c0_g5~~TRINITY_DN4396_c0_g5_i1.p1  ORF type:complete len:245 (+),score=39.73 TRINITY_DN4396_c0_g5_i1:719-1453(+)